MDILWVLYYLSTLWFRWWIKGEINAKWIIKLAYTAFKAMNSYHKYWHTVEI